MTQPIVQLTGQTAINLGTCWGTPNGQDLSSPSYMANGNLCVAESILRRWTTSPGELVDDPNYGYNLNNLISDDLSSSDLMRAGQRAGAEAQKDERVLRCIATVTLTVAGVLTVGATVTTAQGPFRFVVTVSAVTVNLLLVNP
jgi:hypothetical protein